MATATNVMDSARYDLRDRGDNLFASDDVELLDYLNRSLIILEDALALEGSDHVNADTTATLTAANEYFAAPALTITVEDVWQSTNLLTKKDPKWIKNQRQLISATGLPNYWGHEGVNVIHEMAADQNYTMTVHYKVRTAALAAGTTMPHGSEFDQALRQALVLWGQNREENETVMTQMLLNMFLSTISAKTVARNHTPKRGRLDF